MIRVELCKWAEHNPRSDYKSMPWFRMNSDFYRSKKLFGVSAGDKWLWVCLLGLAARENKKGVIEGEADWVASELGCSVKDLLRALEVLGSKGLLIATNVARTPDVRETDSKRSLRNGTERNGTNETCLTALSTSVDSPPAFSVNSLFDTWNAHRGPLPRCTVLNDSRRRKSKARWTEKPDPAYWASCVQKMAASSFCAGGSWATFDWLIANDNNHVKVAEGKYDNPDTPTGESGVDWSKVFGSSPEAPA